MANLQYIGARYVPKFFENPDDQSNDWKAGVDYEALTIVTYNNDSYTSKKVVPDSVGNPADNPQYWACTTKYTAALMALQTDVGILNGKIDYKINFVNTVADLIDYDAEPDMYIMTEGYYTQGDGGEGLYIITGAEPSGYHVNLTNGRYAQLLYDTQLNVLQAGIKNNGSSDCGPKITNLMTFGVDLYFPKGDYLFMTPITNSANFKGHKIIGAGDEYNRNTRFICEVLPTINGVIGGLTIQGVNFHREDLPTLGAYEPYELAYIFMKHSNPVYTDVDTIIEHCYFDHNYCAVYCWGRNLVFRYNLLFYMGDAAGYCLKFDFPDTPYQEETTSPSAFGNSYSGFRGIIIENNRQHYTRNHLVDTTATNCANIKGMVIRNNYIEGAMCVKGYLNNALVQNNIVFQLILPAGKVFELTEMKNTIINGFYCAGSDAYTTQGGESIAEATYASFMTCSGDIVDSEITDVFITNINTSAFTILGNVYDSKFDVTIRKTRDNLNSLNGFVGNFDRNTFKCYVEDLTAATGYKVMSFGGANKAHHNNLDVKCSNDCIKYDFNYGVNANPNFTMHAGSEPFTYTGDGNATQDISFDHSVGVVIVIDKSNNTPYFGWAGVDGSLNISGRTVVARQAQGTNESGHVYVGIALG